MTVKIDDSPAKEEVSGGRPYDESGGEYKRKIQTVGEIRSRLCPPDPCTNDGVDGCYPCHLC